MSETTLHLSQTEVAALLGIDRSRVGQIEQSALRKIRVAVKEEALKAGIEVDEWISECIYEPWRKRGRRKRKR